MPKITFHSNRIYNVENGSLNPSPSKKNVPQWFSDSSRYWFPENKDSLSFKACPALIDAFLSGYVLKTPCDIYFSTGPVTENVDYSSFIIPTTEKGYEDFCGARPDMHGFPKPHGFDKHFHWYPNWMPGLEPGYSALYTHPLNRFDLPFITISGIIDNDKMNTPGLMPFFLKEGFEGLIPKGTPFVQIIPFKREDWESEEKMYSIEEIHERHNYQANKFRVPEGGAYRKKVWSRKRYD
jgi:hypothetical protein